MRTARMRVAVAAAFVVLGASGPAVPQSPGEAGPGVDLAIAIDTSGTMGSLLDAARVDIWDVVARMAAEDPSATLRVAVLTYGNTFGGEAAGWVRVEAPLVGDLDLVSSRLFATRIAGDIEYVARVVRTAAEELGWDSSDEARRMIFVLGNESAAQDPQVTLEEAVQIARDRGIEIHPVYCGPKVGNNDVASWTRLAALAETSLAVLDPAQGAHAVETPFDKDLAALGGELSATYVPVGEAGRESKDVQDAVDRKVAALSPAAAALRAEAKAGQLYTGDWDLVGGVANGTVDLATVPTADLPAALQRMSPAERTAAIAAMAAERERVRGQIADLASQRRRYLAEHGPPGVASAGLSDLILNKIRP